MWRSNTSFMGTSTSIVSPAVKPAQPQPLSQQRQKLNRLTANYAEQVQKALALREVMKGSVYRLQTRCGCPSCHCAQPDGARHSAMVLSWTQGGRSHLRALLPADVERSERLTSNYKQLRRVRRTLVRLHQDAVAALDQLERLLLVPPPAALRPPRPARLAGEKKK